MVHREMNPDEKKYFLNLLKSDYTTRSLMKAMNEKFGEETGQFSKKTIERNHELHITEEASEKSQDDIEKGTETDSDVEIEDDENDTETEGKDGNSEAGDKQAIGVDTEESALIVDEKEEKST
ncbi:predicted protein [Sclerotinia sclerotiorum 1980 UF-70]|uniref:Uncharacterized protein n=2 Tax=Sclerotinia sclerotiorum (strain ATCC 18683 / 1980 / Ss-1) TaxID=665079 RepID=A7F831_SCLS1|nr:predicted protein [Sclerotinia sclerotiorum 1980 UF-70]APA13227.1 hypothetical protein sscle_10g079970 [Sclerotinia sclerotiorum 1980 UF-70]EDN98902.1 predicted protein [Sclerotinia sclerotiorum 1980 UF-70]